VDDTFVHLIQQHRVYRFENGHYREIGTLYRVVTLEVVVCESLPVNVVSGSKHTPGVPL
jgi:hypothetical protein